MKSTPLAAFAALCAGLSFAPHQAVAAETKAQAEANLKADVQQLVTDIKADESKIAQTAESWEHAHSGVSARDAGGAPVPEPASWILMGTLALGAAALATREKKRVQL